MSVLFPALLRFGDVGLLLLRLMVAVVFFDSGWNHLRNPAERSKSIGASTGFTVFLGAAEVLGSVGVARSEEHTSELQSQSNLVCRLLLEKKKKNKINNCAHAMIVT